MHFLLLDKLPKSINVNWGFSDFGVDGGAVPHQKFDGGKIFKPILPWIHFLLYYDRCLENTYYFKIFGAFGAKNWSFMGKKAGLVEFGATLLSWVPPRNEFLTHLDCKAFL